ncbi:MAG: hypothetical protein ACLVAO_10300 [Clostridium fessum]
MSTLDFTAVASFGISRFCAGYTFGKDYNKSQNSRAVCKLGDYL